MSEKIILQCFVVFGFAAGTTIIIINHGWPLFLGILFLTWANNADNELKNKALKTVFADKG